MWERGEKISSGVILPLFTNSSHSVVNNGQTNRSIVKWIYVVLVCDWISSACKSDFVIVILGVCCVAFFLM